MKKLFALITFLIAALSASAQKAAVKTNILYDVTTTLNIGVEFKVAPKWSIDLSGNYNPFDLGKDRKMKHWLVQPEARYWLCEAFNGHFLAIHALGGGFNVADMDLKIFPSFKNYRYQGNMYGAGLGYGYQSCWETAGIWDWKSVRDGFVPTMICTTARTAANGEVPTRRIISELPRRQYL